LGFCKSYGVEPGTDAYVDAASENSEITVLSGR
jgi:hypothetical protein